MNTTTMTKMHHKLVAVTAERDHWKANHDNRVNAAKILMDRTDMPLERIGAYKHYVAALEANQKLRELAESAESEILAVREDNHSMMLEIDGLRTERDRLAAELAKLREQKPVAYLDYWKSDGTGIVRKQRTTGVPFYNSPVPALAELDSPMDIHDLAYELGGTDSGEYHLEPEDLDRIIAAAQAMAAVPDWNVNVERIRDVMHMLGISIEESVECFSAALPTNINRMTLAMKRHLQELAGMTAITPTPFIPDDDTRRNDEAFAAQQAATTPSVPEEWREFVKRTAEVGLHATNSGVECTCYRCVAIRGARALLQSADHSERNLEMVAPDCLTCANLGRVNGLSQESYCDSCVYEGRGWRQNHFVDARKMVDTAKRRCEACAILPCSCK